MKNFGIGLIMISLVVLITCKDKEKEDSSRFLMLTSTAWLSDSLLVDGKDASGPGHFLEKFKGDMKFNKDGTGSFGEYSGTWIFSLNETELVIITESLAFPLTTKIIELSPSSLKITTGFPVIGSAELKIRMTFKPK